MVALFIFIGILILVHGLALGAYLTIYKLKLQTILTRTVGTLVIGTAYSVLIALITTFVIIPPIS